MSKKTREERKASRVKTLHHRKPISIGGSRHNAYNHSWIPENKHRAWHLLFGVLQPQIIAEVINQTYLDTDYEFICVRRGYVT